MASVDATAPVRDSAPVQEKQLDRRDARILSLLSDGRSDSTIARESGISLRTVERRVRSLMDRLGAKTRFQAGVQAARRGWIP
jgi:DNA-binding NarL/FixJ family response regulator